MPASCGYPRQIWKRHCWCRFFCLLIKKTKMVCQEKTEAPDFSVKCIPGYSVHYIADKRHKVFCGHLISDGFQIPLKLPFWRLALHSAHLYNHPYWYRKNPHPKETIRMHSHSAFEIPPAETCSLKRRQMEGEHKCRHHMFSKNQ